jgi:hypothetical protein
MEQLRDIRGLEEIHDTSFVLFVIMIVFVLLLLAGLIMMGIRFFKGKKEDLTRKEVLKRLHEVDMDKPKEAAYKITKYARYLAKEERSEKLFKALESKLERYKYIKNPPAFDAETIGEYQLFLEVVDG